MSWPSGRWPGTWAIKGEAEYETVCDYRRCGYWTVRPYSCLSAGGRFLYLLRQWPEASGRAGHCSEPDCGRLWFPYEPAFGHGDHCAPLRERRYRHGLCSKGGPEARLSGFPADRGHWRAARSHAGKCIPAADAGYPGKTCRSPGWLLWDGDCFKRSGTHWGPVSVFLPAEYQRPDQGHYHPKCEIPPVQCGDYLWVSVWYQQRGTAGDDSGGFCGQRAAAADQGAALIAAVGDRFVILRERSGCDVLSWKLQQYQI